MNLMKPLPSAPRVVFIFSFQNYSSSYTHMPLPNDIRIICIVNRAAKDAAFDWQDISDTRNGMARQSGPRIH
jgi:hypothetical protein